MADSTPTLPVGTDYHRYRSDSSRYRYGLFSSQANNKTPSENTYANVTKGTDINAAVNDGATTSVNTTVKAPLGAAQNNPMQPTPNAPTGTTPINSNQPTPNAPPGTTPINSKQSTPNAPTDESENESEGDEVVSITHEIGPDFLWLGFTCFNCGSKYNTVKEAVESYREDKCVPVVGAEPMNTNIFLNFPNYSYLCFGCGYEERQFGKVVEHMQSSDCKKCEEHVILLDFDTGIMFACKNKNCKGKFSTLNEALDHWCEKNFPNPQSFAEIPAKHMMLVDQSTSSFHCRNCSKKFETINEAFSHWRDKNVTRLSLQNFWIDFNSKALICARCGEAFNDPESAEMHRNKEEDEHPAEHFIILDVASDDMTCQTCSERFSSLSDAVEHLKIETSFIRDGDTSNDCSHKIKPDFASKKFKCGACDLNLPNLKLALGHSLSPSTRHYISIDLETSKIQCRGCDLIFGELNSAADHWKFENWPCIIPGVKTSLNHKVGLDRKTKEFVCLTCGDQMKTLDDVVTHWKKMKMSKIVKSLYRVPFFACTGLCF